MVCNDYWGKKWSWSTYRKIFKGLMDLGLRYDRHFMILVVYLKLKKSTSLGKLQLNWPYPWQANALELSYIYGVKMLHEERIQGYLYRSNYTLIWYVLLVLSRKGIFRGMLIVKKTVTGKEHLRIRDDFLITQKIWRKKGRGVLK